MSAVILRDEIIHYEVLGRGRPVVFLHDWVGSWRYWIPAMQAASISFRAYALDLWGFGDTAKNPSYYSVEQQINLLEEFLQKMGIAKIALAGHGLGAIVGLLFTARHPDQVDRVLAVSLPASEGAVHTRLRTAAPTELADWLLNRSPATEPVRVEAPKADPRAIQLSLANLHALGLPDLPARTHTPCLLVHGANDPAVEPPRIDPPPSQPEHLHTILFEGSGHFPMLDEPAKFNRLLADFLSLLSGESPRQLQLKEEWKRRVR
jgi:pimeloyl-ACP methyl ester carboxylesterase